MMTTFAKIACPSENRMVRAYGEGRRLGARAASFPQPSESARSEEMIVKRGRLSRDDRAKEDVGG